ncbi:MAG: cytochrome P450 [Acidimicrobiales bacterium]
MTATEIPGTDLGLPNPNLNEFWLRPMSQIEPDLARLRADAPVTFLPEMPVPEGVPLPQGPGAWVLTRHADILHVSKNPQLFSSADGITLLDAPPEFNEFFSSMIAMDDPRHARLRRIVSAGFTPRMLKRLEDSVQTVAAEIVDDVGDRGEVDFVVDVAAALPLKIVCELMGVPESQYRFVFDRTNVILGATDPEYVPDQTDILTAMLTAGGDLAAVMHEVAESKRGGDGTDLTSQLMNAELEDDRLTGADLASFFILLVVAGNETTRNAIAWGLKFLTDHPEQRAIWAADFEGVAPTAVEEIVRLASPVTYMRRTALADTELGGQPVRAGDKVAMYYLAANRDEAVFDRPYDFDVRRDPNPHVGFGGPGPHFCLGAHLARREITVMFRELFRRLPDIRATSEPALLSSSFIHGVKHLQAEFTPGSPAR